MCDTAARTEKKSSERLSKWVEGSFRCSTAFSSHRLSGNARRGAAKNISDSWNGESGFQRPVAEECTAAESLRWNPRRKTRRSFLNSRAGLCLEHFDWEPVIISAIRGLTVQRCNLKQKRKRRETTSLIFSNLKQMATFTNTSTRLHRRYVVLYFTLKTLLNSLARNHTPVLSPVWHTELES